MANNDSSSSFNVTTVYGNKLPWMFVFSITFLVSIIVNPLIVWIIYKDNRLITITNYLIANMAASDLLGALFVFPTQIVRINFEDKWMIGGDIGNALCKLYVFKRNLSISVSLYSCVLIAIHRYFAVVHPMKRPFHSKTKCIIAAIWIFSSLQCGSSFYFFSTVGQGDNLYCDVPTKIMSTFIISSYSNIALTIGLPPLLITVAYALTVYKLYQHKVPGIQDNLTKRKRKQQNKKVLKMCLAVVAALYFSFGFRFIFLVLDRQGKLSHFSKTVHMDLENMSIFILSLILIYNFFIYLIFNGIYRDNIKTMITRCCSFTYSQFGSGIRSIPKAYSGEQMREIPHNGLQNHI